jgi:hypothetical protein
MLAVSTFYERPHARSLIRSQSLAVEKSDVFDPQSIGLARHLCDESEGGLEDAFPTLRYGCSVYADEAIREASARGERPDASRRFNVSRAPAARRLMHGVSGADRMHVVIRSDGAESDASLESNSGCDYKLPGSAGGAKRLDLDQADITFVDTRQDADGLAKLATGISVLKNTFSKDSVLAIGGEDLPWASSVRKSLETIRDAGIFKKIYIEPLDIDIPGVDALPMGFVPLQIWRPGEVFLKKLILRSSVNANNKKGVLASWGGIYPGLDKTIESRKAARHFIETQIAWATENLVSGKLVNSFHAQAYLTALAGSKFMLCPLGGGVQSAKWMEAILVQTIPIVAVGNNGFAYEKLARMGFAILTVAKWEDLLQIDLELEYKRLVPKLECSRNTMLTPNWVEMLRTGQLQCGLPKKSICDLPKGD